MFVPVITSPPRHRAAPPTAESRELADRIADTVRTYRDTHPGVSGGDLRQAFRSAQSELLSEELPRPHGDRARPLVAVFAGLILAVGLGVFLYMRQRGGEPLGSPVFVALTIGALAVVGGLVAVLRR